MLLLLIITACLSSSKCSDTVLPRDSAPPSDTACVWWCPVASAEPDAECITSALCAPVCLPPGHTPDMSTCLYRVMP